jgi:acetyl-CoA carboxylase biotin carboxyl carrier protein
MDAQRMKAAIDTMAASDLSEMELSHQGWTLRLVRHAPAAAHAPAGASTLPARRSAAKPGGAASAASASHEIQAPMHGIVHLQAAPGQPPFVKVGESVSVGQTVCTVEAMKVFNEVRSEQAGRVLAVQVSTGSEVEAGQVLVVLAQGADV